MSASLSANTKTTEGSRRFVVAALEMDSGALKHL
jgi:hypothetical protein